MKPGTHYKRLTTEEAKEIKDLLSEFSISQIVEMTGRSNSTVNRICKMSSEDIDGIDYRHRKNQQEKGIKGAEAREKKEKENMIINVSPSINKITINEITCDRFNVDEKTSIKTKLMQLNYPKLQLIDSVKEFKCGLVANRHEMPCKNYIFQKSFNSSLMFDFEAQEAEVVKFFNNFGVNDGKKLVLYLTGLQTAFASVVKVCSEKKISLDVMHHDKSSNTWHRHEVLNFNDEEDEKIYKKIINESDIYFRSMHFIGDLDNFKVIRITVNGGSEIVNILCDNEDADNIYFKLLQNQEIRLDDCTYSFELLSEKYVESLDQFVEGTIYNFNC